MHSTAPAHYSTVQGYHHPNANGEVKQAWSLYRVKITLPSLTYYYSLQASSALTLLVGMLTSKHPLKYGTWVLGPFSDILPLSS